MDVTIENAGSFTIGAFYAIWLGFCMQDVFRDAGIDKPSEGPPTVDPEQWKRLVGSAWSGKGNSAGKVLGILERVLFFTAVWFDALLLVAGWLTFKVAAKWQAWNFVVRVPSEFSKDLKEDKLIIEELIARRKWSAALYGRLLIGTLFNFLCALAGVALGKVTLKLISGA